MNTKASEQANELCRQLRTIAQSENGSYPEAKKLLKSIEKLRSTMSTDDRVECALVTETYAFALLNIGRMSRTKTLQKDYQVQGYKMLSDSVDAFLRHKRDLGSMYRANNLGIELLHVLNEPEGALYYLLRARRIYKHIPKSVRPLHDFFPLLQSTQIANCCSALGDNAAALRILRASIGRAKIRLRSPSCVRAFGEAYKVLSQLMVAESSAKLKKQG